MAQEISVSVFERNLMMYNKKNLKRSYSSIERCANEYVRVKPLGASNKFVIKTTVDKEYYEAYSELLKSFGCTLLGDTNDYFISKVVDDYDSKKQLFTQYAEQIEAIRKDLVVMNEKRKPYKEVANDDVEFYFLPYNEGVTTLFEFIGVYKDQLQEFAKANDITIMMAITGYTNQIAGFIGFNFFDADKKEEEVVIDYACNVNIGVDFKKGLTAYAAALLLSGIGENEDELKVMNTHIAAENVRFTK